jgi:hypothetical protein
VTGCAIYRPTLGVVVSEENARRFLGDPEMRVRLGVTRHGRKDDSPYAGPGTILHGLIEHAVANRFLASPHGRTDQIFRSKEGQLFPPVEHLGRFDPAMRKYGEWVLGLPFAQAKSAFPDGVLWVLWGEGRKEPAGFPPFTSQGTFIGAVDDRLNPVTEAVAAMYAIHRYHDPDRVSEMLPARRP